MNSPTHVPVLLDRVVALVAPALERSGSVFVDATLGLGGHTEAVLDRCPRGPRRRRRPRPARPRARRRAAGSVRGTHHARARGLRRDPGRARRARHRRRSTGSSSTSASPRCSSTSGSAGSPTPRTHPSTCGWTTPRARPRPTCSTATPPPSSHGSCAPTARRSSPGRSPGRSCKARETEPFTDSARLVELLRATIPAPARRTGGHPAKRTFQALRIEVNDELGVLRRAIPAAVDSIGIGGRVVVMSYHSLEDRLVKQAFAAGTTSTVPPDLPVVPAGHEPPLRSLTRGAEKASPRRSPRTRAPPPCGCAPSNESTTTGSHHRGDNAA